MHGREMGIDQALPQTLPLTITLNVSRASLVPSGGWVPVPSTCLVQPDSSIQRRLSLRLQMRPEAQSETLRLAQC